MKCGKLISSRMLFLFPAPPGSPAGFSSSRFSSFLALSSDRLLLLFTIFLYLLFFILSSTPISAEILPLFPNDEDPETLATQIIQNMTDVEILGQTLMFGYNDAKPDPEILEWIEERKLGGVKIFGRNADNLSQLTRTIAVYQEKSLESRFGIPLLIATDQEGGLVRHIRGKTSITAGNMAIGADGLPYTALQTGRLIGKELREIGINMNFAPTVDLFLNPDSDVIATRSFGQEPNRVGILGLAFAKGQQEYGIITTAKHFPGHGDTAVDSHSKLPVVNTTLETLRKRDLIPYKLMITADIPAIMVGHLAFPEITGDLTPATLSYKLLTLLLRREMNFQGVTITDDLHMYGVRSDGKPLDEIAYKAMMAGSDLLMLSSGGPERTRMYNRLLNEMKNNPGFTTRVKNAASRVLELKIRWLKKKSPAIFSTLLLSPVPDGDNKTPEKESTLTLTPEPSSKLPSGPSLLPPSDFLLQQAARSITLIRSKLFPLPPSRAGKVLLIGNYKNFFWEGLRRYPDAKSWFLDGDKGNKQQLLRTSQNFDSIIVLLTDKNTARILDVLSPLAGQVIVFSIFSPTILTDLPWVQTSLALYGATKESFRSAFAALAGDFNPQGSLPITLRQNRGK